ETGEDEVKEKRELGPPARQTAKVGFEITFSNRDLQFMNIDKKKYKQNPMKDEFKNVLEFDDYYNFIRNTYIDRWSKAVKEGDRGGMELENKEWVGSKGGPEVGRKFNYTRVDYSDEEGTETRGV